MNYKLIKQMVARGDAAVVLAPIQILTTQENEYDILQAGLHSLALQLQDWQMPEAQKERLGMKAGRLIDEMKRRKIQYEGTARI